LNLNCVIVEDQLMFLQMLNTMLQGMPRLRVVGTARTEAEGLAACEKHQPDLLVLDLTLPDGNGINVAHQLARLKPSAKTIVLSGEASTFICPASLDQHIHAVLDKTQAFDDLAEELKELLPKRTSRARTVADRDPRQKLSARELEIFLLIGSGLLSKEIASQLDLSTHTIQAHRKNIADKLGTTGPELGQLAVKHYHETLGQA
jgi:DNA-binding NarL/FixJ family response regulator